MWRVLPGFRVQGHLLHVRAQGIQALNGSSAGLLSALNRHLQPPASYLVFLYATSQRLLNISQAVAQPPAIPAPQGAGGPLRL